MLGLGWSEMLVVAVVVLIVVGPKDLPMMLRNLGRMMGSVRRMSNEFRREIDKAIAADEIAEAKKAISDPLSQTSAEISREFNAIRNGKVEPSGRLKPADPAKQSVADEIRAQAGMAPLAVEKLEPKAMPTKAAVSASAKSKPKPRTPKAAPAAALETDVPVKKAAPRKKSPAKAASKGVEE